MEPINLQPGEEVGYVPHLDYAMCRDDKGEYPWEMCWQRIVHPGRKQPETGEFEILDTAKRRDEVLNAIRSDPLGAELRKRLTFSQPIQVWRAIVFSVDNEKGLVSLDIKSNTGGLTLHHDDVKYDPQKRTPHSCHKIESASPFPHNIQKRTPKAE